MKDSNALPTVPGDRVRTSLDLPAFEGQMKFMVLSVIEGKVPLESFFCPGEGRSRDLITSTRKTRFLNIEDHPSQNFQTTDNSIKSPKGK
jgi:hypothetical protein